MGRALSVSLSSSAPNFRVAHDLARPRQHILAVPESECFGRIVPPVEMPAYNRSEMLCI
jgi:hypothetical protein